MLCLKLTAVLCIAFALLIRSMCIDNLNSPINILHLVINPIIKGTVNGQSCLYD